MALLVRANYMIEGGGVGGGGGGSRGSGRCHFGDKNVITNQFLYA